MYDNDTIASISTAPGIGAIGIVRMSGKSAFEVAEKIFQSKKGDFKTIKSHTVSYGKIVNPVSGFVVDEVLVTKMQGPFTYTTEDIVEINCHGGTAVLRKVLNLICSFGVRIATPGEFTKRAFLNGRIDLSQAEAVIDIINSKANESLKASIDQLQGNLSKGIKNVRERLISILAHIEALVDYPEYDIEELSINKIVEDAEYIKSELVKIASTFEKGKIIREGLTIVIVGRPNVGKSSLLNSFSGKERAIVTDIPGTTRDIIEEYIEIAGIPTNLIDTAGIRETSDYVENLGVQRAKACIQKADIILFMLDAAEGLMKEDISIFEDVKDKNVVFIINKIDKSTEKNIIEIEQKFEQFQKIRISVKEDEGLEKIEKYIEDNFLSGLISINNEILLTNSRHKSEIDLSIQNICECLTSLKSGMPLDIISIDIKNCANHLGNITGESVNEDVIREIFSKFCIGK